MAPEAPAAQEHPGRVTGSGSSRPDGAHHARTHHGTALRQLAHVVLSASYMYDPTITSTTTPLLAHLQPLLAALRPAEDAGLLLASEAHEGQLDGFQPLLHDLQGQLLLALADQIALEAQAQSRRTPVSEA